MGENILVINTGSASKKYALYNSGELRYSTHFEYDPEGGFIATTLHGNGKEEEKVKSEQYTHALQYVTEHMLEHSVIAENSDIKKVALRVVAPGSYFVGDLVVDEQFLFEINKTESKDPLHIDPFLASHKEVKDIIPQAKIVAISDSLFHSGMPDVARRYALPRKDADTYDFFRYGFHGISVESVVNNLREEESLPEKVVVCHLGGGSSLTALKEGRSIETSMGYSPLEGLVMATRPGQLDPSVVLSLQEEKGLKPEEIRNYLYKECGVKGASGISDDIRELLKLEVQQHEGAREALALYAYHVRKQIGAMIAVLNGIDLLVFTGTIGERSDVMRARICDGLGNLGIALDLKKNSEAIKDGGTSTISEDAKIVTIKVIHTDEMREMARRAEFLK